MIFTFILLLIVFIIAIIYVQRKGAFTAYVQPVPSQNAMINYYSYINSWGSSIPINDCETLFIENNNDTMGMVTLTGIDDCITEGSCTIHDSPICLDIDQINVQKMYHVCTLPSNSNAAGGCVKRDGVRAKINDVETFWNFCSSVPRCNGSIGTIDLTHGSTDICIQNNSGIKPTGCDLSDETQIFRIERFGVNSEGIFYSDPGGRLARITKRGDNEDTMCLAPQSLSDINLNASPSDHIVLVNCNVNSNTNDNPSHNRKGGIWWALVPALNSYVQQIVYVGNPESMSSLTSEADLFTYLTSRYSLKAESGYIGLTSYASNTIPTQFLDMSLYKTELNSDTNLYPF